MLKNFTSSVAARKDRFAARKAELGLFGALKSEGGAIDLASIMVGVIVIGIIAGVIAATVFAVIPWAQNNAAQQSLSAVATAESVQYAQSAGDNGTAVYLDKAGLETAADNASNTVLLQDSKAVAVAATNSGAGYDAYSLSATGEVYEITSASPSTVVDLGKSTDSATTTALTADGFQIVAGSGAITASN